MPWLTVPIVAGCLVTPSTSSFRAPVVIQLDIMKLSTWNWLGGQGECDTSFDDITIVQSASVTKISFKHQEHKKPVLCEAVNYSLVVRDTDWELWLDDDKIQDPIVGELFASSIEQSLPSAPPALPPTLIAILEHPRATPLLAAVAAQRIRAIYLDSEDARQRAWEALHRHLLAWLAAGTAETYKYALSALPSAIQVGRAAAVPVVAKWITEGSAEVAESAAMGMFTGSARAGSLTDCLSESDVSTLRASVLCRLQSSRTNSLRATLIWSLGPLATNETLPGISQIIAKAFIRGHGTEDATAVRLGKMITRRWQAAAITTLKLSFEDGQKFDRFMALVCLLP
jgi:hypothetical protein